MSSREETIRKMRQEGIEPCNHPGLRECLAADCKTLDQILAKKPIYMENHDGTRTEIMSLELKKTLLQRAFNR